MLSSLMGADLSLMFHLQAICKLMYLEKAAENGPSFCALDTQYGG